MAATISIDKELKPFEKKILERSQRILTRERELTQGKTLSDFATGYLYFGLHKIARGWVFREWAPNASSIHLVGDFSDWKTHESYRLQRKGDNWEIELGEEQLRAGQFYKLFVQWNAGVNGNSGDGYRLPSYGRRMVQDENTKIFSAQIENHDPYTWKTENFKRSQSAPLIYEAHVGMSSEDERVSTFIEFRDNVLPRIQKLGYNTIQLMAIQEHPYYGSFGYHVSNFFSVSSRFGTATELKSLIDAAHGMGIAVIMDLVHSHAVKNVEEGLGLFDGTEYQYFHAGARRLHSAWDSLCFNYAKPEVMHFLLSNCKYWLEEYRFDGFRFDGVTSMMYLNHGLGVNFSGYPMYYDGRQDEDAITYLALANKLIHEVHPDAICIAEDVSGMPGLASPIDRAGFGFNYRLAMGVPDYWIKIIKELPDEKWSVGSIYYEMTNHRAKEKTIAYSESHDQALVGDKTIMFRLAGTEMYNFMNAGSQSIIIDRAVALHKMIRLVVIACSGGGYLNFMGNEFGHPEWIDFPREGNGWSHKFARRQWSLVDNASLRFHFLSDFDRDMIHLVKSADLFAQEFPESRYQHEDHQVLLFERMNYLFLFNFNPTQSFENYKLPAAIGNYKVILNSDAAAYGGFERVDSKQIYKSSPDPAAKGNSQFSIYLPTRTALVLKAE